MPDIAVWERVVLVLSLVCPAVLLGHLWIAGLLPRYPFLASFLTANSLQAAAFLSFKPRSDAYAVAYFISAPILWLFSYLVVLELYRLILEDYPGISSIGRRAVSWCMAIAVLVAVGSGLAGSRGLSGSSSLLRIFNALERSATLGLLLFLVLIQVFLFRYRLRLSPNRLVYSVGYGFYFGVGVASDIVEAQYLGGRFFYPISVAAATLADLTLLAGVFLLSRSGEVKPVPHTADLTAERQRLNQQLTEMNQLLARVARRRH